ncbi:MAG: alpha-ribazole kinase [Bacillota bacterium]
MDKWLGSARVRDLLVLPVARDKVAVIGCDSSGGIGPKERDVVKVPAYIVGRFTSRVALMEVLASGAIPAALVSTLCAEPDPTGIEVKRGIADELVEAGLAGEIALTGSSEKNVSTEQTGLGITVIGFAAPSDLRFGMSLRDDDVVCIGVPKVGREVYLDDPEIVDTQTLRLLLALPGVHEVAPAGSRGIAHEARELATSAGLALELRESPGVNPSKSAGPATCLVASVEPGFMDTLSGSLKKPVTNVGWLR